MLQRGNRILLTVADALQLNEFQGAQVVGGKGGLNHAIAWVHIASGPDAPQWVHGGELVLTTARNLPVEPAEQCQYLQAMADAGVVALALTTGRTINDVPDYLRDLADKNNFPLIEISYQAPFIDIAKATNERIAQENMAMVERALTIHRVLTQLVLDGGDLSQLAGKLAGLIGQSISIENHRFEILASANIAEVDEARRFTLSEGRTDPRLVQALDDEGILGQLRTTLRPVFIAPMPHVGLELERILAPIVVHGEIYGYVWIIANDRPLTDLDHLAIESGATIAALMMLHQEALQNAEASLKGSLLSQLIEGEPGRETVLTDQALRYGLDLTAPYVMLLIESPDQLYRRINQQAKGIVVGQFAGQVVMLAKANTDIPALVKTIQAQASGSRLRIGVSAAQRGTQAVGTAHQQCRELLHITQRLHDPRPTVYFDDLGYLHALYRAGVSSLSTNPYIPRLRRLLGEQQADLFNTLEVYLDAGGNGVQTAETLHVHRSTLNYRLDRIAEIAEVTLSDPATRTNLQVALKLMRLFEVE
jgi:PucR family transcriptional regulator, purine catabolism regulatory protein